MKEKSASGVRHQEPRASAAKTSREAGIIACPPIASLSLAPQQTQSSTSPHVSGVLYAVAKIS